MKIKKYNYVPNENYFAVIDTETTLENEVMSIGIVIAKKSDFLPVDEKYYVITPTYKKPAMYSYVLDYYAPKTVCKREKAISDIISLMKVYNISDIFAYNARFDYGHLPELRCFKWYDIMKVAAYKQYNHKIPCTAVCCSTGRLKGNYGVEPMLQMLLGNKRYHESHNAMCDAKDELKIMQLLEQPISCYVPLKVSDKQHQV